MQELEIWGNLCAQMNAIKDAPKFSMPFQTSRFLQIKIDILTLCKQFRECYLN